MQKKTKNNKKAKLFFLYYAVIVILLIQGYTFSKYKSVSTGNAEIDVAKFYFQVENENQQIELNLNDTLTANAYSNDVIVPGTSGTITLNLDFSNIDVATNYRVSLDTENTKIPENLKLYIDQANTIEFSGYTGITEIDSTTITRNIYWKWNYTSTDETQEWMAKEIKVSLDITAEQRTN